MSQISNDTSTVNELVVPVVNSKNRDAGSGRDEVLNDIRSGRRLSRIAASVESFMTNQVGRLEKAIADCERAAENDRIVRQMLAEFENEKSDWEEQRQAEIRRLSLAGEKLAQGWEQLEKERTNFVDRRK